MLFSTGCGHVSSSVPHECSSLPLSSRPLDVELQLSMVRSRLCICAFVVLSSASVAQAVAGM